MSYLQMAQGAGSPMLAPAPMTGIMNAQPSAAPAAPDFAAITQAIGKRFPVLKPHLDNTVMQFGKGGPEENLGRQMETYPPWESDNPNPGKTTLEYYNRNPDGGFENAAAADMLHIIGAIHPETGKPVDATYRGFKDQLSQSLTPEQLAIDQNAHARSKAEDPEDKRSFQDWMDQSRIDAYMRAGLFPDQNPQWKGALNPSQEQIMNQAMQYLQGQQSSGAQ